MALTLVEIERMLQAAKKKALDMGVIVGISIVDARGDLLAALRLDGALWRTMPVSRGKAYASAAFGAPSAELTERADNPVMRARLSWNFWVSFLSKVPCPSSGRVSCLVLLASAGHGARRMKKSHVLESAPFNTGTDNDKEDVHG